MQTPPTTDPRAASLLSGTPRERLAFRMLARLTAKPTPLSTFAREQAISRQEIYRRLALASAAGYGPEVAALRRGEAAPVPVCTCPDRHKHDRHIPACPCHPKAKRAAARQVAA